MGNITISLEKEDEEILRAEAAKKYKNKKGSLAKVISESLRALKKKSKKQKAIQRQLEWMDRGFDLGGTTIKHRSELYDRK